MITRNLAIAQSDTGYLTWKGAGRTEQIELGEFATIGRDITNQIILGDEFTSLRHARIERKTGGGFLLRDLRSRNGTYVNGTRVMEALLNSGDRLRIGQTDLDFTWHRTEALDEILPTSKNAEWREQLERLPNIAQSAFPVLLTGPSGSGKDVLAQNIHLRSSRRKGPFVSVNCSALSESLVESELFGHVRGSFTGATGDRKGAFEAARGGTLFLDEIGDLPWGLQPKLLRALENAQVQPVGSDKPLQTDVRILAATHHDLKRLIFENKFRADLYFRLHVVQIQVPPLNERMEDFEDLFYFFARKMRVRFSHGAIQRLKGHSFPGNIRELRNVIARAKAFCGAVEVTEREVEQFIDVLPAQSGSEHPFGSHVSRAERRSTSTAAAARPSRPVIKEIEEEMIKTRLIANRGNQRKTAMDLGMPKSTLHDRIRSYGIDVDKLLDDSKTFKL